MTSGEMTPIALLTAPFHFLIHLLVVAICSMSCASTSDLQMPPNQYRSSSVVGISAYSQDELQYLQ
jgi:hypothetical protein